jgi:hypothetical protein
MVKGDPDYLGRCFTQPIVIYEKNKGNTKLEWNIVFQQQQQQQEF